MRHADQQRHRNLRASLNHAFHALSGRSKADLSTSEAAGAELTPPSPGAKKPLCSTAAASSSNGRSDDEPATAGDSAAVDEGSIGVRLRIRRLEERLAAERAAASGKRARGLPRSGRPCRQHWCWRTIRPS